MRLAEAFLPLAVEKTAARLADLSEKHAATGRPLGARKWLAFRDYFLPELACGVRIEEVLEIPEPPFYDALKSQLALLGIDTQLDFLNTVGLTARNTILVRSGQLTRTLLFHEMVQVEQYRQLGIRAIRSRLSRRAARKRFRLRAGSARRTSLRSRAPVRLGRKVRSVGRSQNARRS